MQAAMAALVSQLGQPDVAREPARAQLLTARLAAAMAHVAEASGAQCDLLATGGTALLRQLVDLYVRTAPGGGPDEAAGAEEDGQVPVQQAVVWLVGVAAMSAHCPLDFVAAVAPRLTDALKDLDLQSPGRLTAVYTLMSLCNLSYFFAAIERADAGGAAGGTSPRLEALYATLGIILAGVLFEGDVEATVEATRLLGNISFTNTGRDWLEANRCDEVILVFLGHEDLRVVYNCFGVMLNLTAASTCRVVRDAALLQLLLKHTGRYTHHEGIAAAARDERRLLLASALPTEGEAAARAATEAAKGFAEQTADLVEKLLANVFDLVHGESAAAA
ncbi:hypothetical protein STCU_07217 [Strigomonas culicis]|uniref:Ataxin-10 domain-containing protein n=1 Tax=Strigomonas culicis TaxID=28005 RepID=S9VMC5_9TRYP|nr:hypothetical protein STCU_07217 [Strigomonas culicis]|eukprot:EPY24365.1 hypothetical protein STCU_07217 [Strigomonas culicis]